MTGTERRGREKKALPSSRRRLLSCAKVRSPSQKRPKPGLGATELSKARYRRLETVGASATG